ncbi:hypothetical protein ACU61A_09390 [Pseudonocardia sichuanensis]
MTTTRRTYALVLGGLVLVAAVALTLAITLRPAPLTGDVAADAACNALASAAIGDDGQVSGAKLVTLSDDERRAIVREVLEHAEQSTIDEIRNAGLALGAANSVGGMPILGENIGFMMGFGQFGSVCADHGWTPQAAGVIE